MKLKKNGEPKLTGWKAGTKRVSYKKKYLAVKNLCVDLIMQFGSDEDWIRIQLTKLNSVDEYV